MCLHEIVHTYVHIWNYLEKASIPLAKVSAFYETLEEF